MAVFAVAERTPRAPASRTGVRWTVALAAAWVLTRAAMMLAIGPAHIGNFVPNEAYGDVVGPYYHAYIGIHHGWVPYKDFSFEYPPGSLLPLAIVPPGMTAFRFTMCWEAEMLVLDALILAAVVRLARLAGRDPRLAAGAWIVGGLALTGLTVARNDLVVCVAIAWAFVFLRENRALACGLMLGLGTVTKIWPILLLPLALYVCWERRGRLFLGATAPLLLTTIVMALTGTLAPFMYDVVHYHSARGLEIEAVAGLPFLLYDAVAHRYPEWTNDYGSINLVTPHAVVTVTSVATIGVCAVIAWLAYRRRAGADPRTFGLLSTALVAGTLITTKVFSAQYIVWLLVVVCCAAASGSVRRLWVGVTLVAVALTGYLYPYNFRELVLGDLRSTALALLRDVAVLIVAAGVAYDYCRATPRRTGSDHDAEDLLERGHAGGDLREPVIA